MARHVKKLPVRDKFLILTNGKRSEKNYFEALRSNLQTVYKISVKFMNDDPEALVSHAIGEKEQSNRVWCVFDKDEFPKDAIYRALKQAEQYDIGVAFSNMAFEVWLIDHFNQCESEKSSDGLIKTLDNLLKENGYSKGYSKADSDVIQKVFMPRWKDAVHHADIVHQKRVLKYREAGHQDNHYPICDWNSYTNVYKLVDALKMQEKD